MRKLFYLFSAFIIPYGIGLVLLTHFGEEAFYFQSSYLMFGVLVVVSVGVGAIVAKVMSMGIVKDLNKLRVLVEKIEHKDIEGMEYVTRHDEMGDLAHALQRMSSQDDALRQANEDPLTGLANRRYLMQKLNALFASEKPVSLLFIDLDGFKPINDTYGHEMGDDALKAISERYSACVRESDVLSRIGGDEFVMMFNGLDDKSVLEERAKKVLELTNEPIWIGDTRIKMGASIGVSISPVDGKDPDELMNSADEAMYAAKQGGKNSFRFYS